MKYGDDDDEKRLLGLRLARGRRQKNKLVEKYEFFMKKTKYLGYATEEVTLKITQHRSS